MAVTLNASTTTGLVQSADLSGSLNIQSNGTTVLGVTSTGIAVTGTHSVTGTQSVGGNLSFNSGYGSSAVAYGCRAWVNFNGTGTPAIRASGNVTSITDNGTGDYTVNFTTAMPDANYCAISSTGVDISNSQTAPIGTRATSSVRVFIYSSSDILIDTNYVAVAIFR
jgi:hypothetical protein